LPKRTGGQFDADCVSALLAHADEAASLLLRFADPTSHNGYSVDL
jgi:hypothetical protein